MTTEQTLKFRRLRFPVFFWFFLNVGKSAEGTENASEAKVTVPICIYQSAVAHISVFVTSSQRAHQHEYQHYSTSHRLHERCQYHSQSVFKKSIISSLTSRCRLHQNAKTPSSVPKKKNSPTALPQQAPFGSSK